MNGVQMEIDEPQLQFDDDELLFQDSDGLGDGEWIDDQTIDVSLSCL